jgi:cell division protein FtsI (penicillin-binding protein 3)
VTPTAPQAKIAHVTRAGDPADFAIAAMQKPKEEHTEPPPVGPPAPGGVRVPDLTGMAAKEAVRVLSNAGLVPQIEGSGRSIRQIPSPGSTVPRGTSVRLVFEPAS